MKRVLAAMAVSALGLVVLLGGAAAGIGPFATAATQICGKYDTAPVQGGRYIVQNDLWGADDPQCLNVFDTGFQVTVGDHTSTNGPASYPSIYQGCHYGLCSTGTEYPRLVTDLGSITSSWAFNVTNAPDDKYDVAYDLWFDPEPRVGGAPTGAELMIWLNQKADPPPIGTKRDTVTIAGRQWDVWVGTNTVPVISYVLVGAQTTSVSNLPLTDFVTDAQQSPGTRTPVVRPDWYLTSIEAGFEPWTNGRAWARGRSRSPASASDPPARRPVRLSPPRPVPGSGRRPGPCGPGGGELVAERVFGVADGRGDLRAVLQLVVQAGERERVALVDRVVVGLVGELQGEDPEVGEVLPVDAREGLGDHHPQAEVARADRGVLAGAALAVVVAADDRVAGLVLDLLGLGRVVARRPG